MRTARHVVTLIYSVTCNGELDVLCTLRSVILEIDKKKSERRLRGSLKGGGWVRQISHIMRSPSATLESLVSTSFHWLSPLSVLIRFLI